MNARGWRLVVLIGLVGGLAGCALDNVAARQEKATGLWGELVAGRTYGQSFVSERAHLYRIELGTATYARVNAAPVIFHLRASPQATTDVVSVTVPGPEVQNERPTSITFPPLPDSQGRSYYFYLEAPQASPGNAITVYADERDDYRGGTAYRDGQAVAGDLVFTAYSQETFTPGRVGGDFAARAGRDGPFFACYGLGVLATALAALLAWRRRPR